MQLSYQEIASLKIREELLMKKTREVAMRGAIANVQGQISVTSEHMKQAAKELDKQETSIFDRGARATLEAQRAKDLRKSTGNGKPAN